ncbi:formyltransferase family protein [Ferrovum sp.]|uniref:methionyl-tRNA formyltransferase n=1 Tax=Ferrovum sp. TaxID=2609467 RepID=UPI00263910C5|nr:formyltransferase family protein [Ferrovum sp.]
MRVVLFTEHNSPYGAEVMRRLHSHRDISALTIVTRGNGILCDYYLLDAMQVDLVEETKSLGIPLIQQENLDAPDFLQRIRFFDPDVLVLANYQKKVNKILSATARIAAINFHPSPLPRYAGLAPFFWMAKQGELVGGVSCCLVADVIDSGDLLAQTTVPLSGTETKGEIRDRHFTAAYNLVSPVMSQLARLDFNLIQQDASRRTYFSRPSVTDLIIDWTKGTVSVMRTIRAGAPFPGACAILINGRGVRITDAEIYPEKSLAHPGTVIYRHSLPIVATSDGWVRINAIGCFSDDYATDTMTLPLNQSPPLEIAFSIPLEQLGLNIRLSPNE